MTYIVVPINCIGEMTLRQKGVAACLLDGLEIDRIAEATRLSVFTVAATVKRLMAGTGSQNRAMLELRLWEMIFEDFSDQEVYFEAD